MFTLHLHKDAQKELRKAPKHIRKKTLVCFEHFIENGTTNFPYPIDTLKGEFKKFKYLEIKMNKDYRIIFRIDDKNIFIRYAGTHNRLGTG